MKTGISEQELQLAGADFVFDLPADRPIRILQVTDTQIIDSSQCRYPERLSAREKELWAPDRVDERMTRYLDAAVAAASPDLIVHTGDFVYGEFDDSGRMLDRHIAIMEKYGLPWALALGNHERETRIGAYAICTALERAPHCLFRGKKLLGGEPLEGHGNYSVLLRRGGEDAAALYLLDSGCGTEELPCGIGPRQRKWLLSSSERFGGIPAFAFFHIGPLAGLRAAERHGYSFEDFRPLTIEGGGDFGEWGERVRPEHCIDADGSLMALFEKIGVKGVFTGHFHKLRASFRLGGVRLTYGLKTGEYDTHPERSGGTLITLPAANEEGFSVEYIAF